MEKWIWFACMVSVTGFAQTPDSITWKDTVAGAYDTLPVMSGSTYRILQVDFDKLWKFVHATDGQPKQVENKGFILDLPLPDGTNEEIRFQPSRLLSHKLVKKYPVRSFKGRGTKNKSIQAVLDIGQNEMHISILLFSDTYLIAPLRPDKKRYISYNRNDIDSSRIKKPKEQ